MASITKPRGERGSLEEERCNIARSFVHGNDAVQELVLLTLWFLTEVSVG